MTKNELIEVLLKIPGNPKIVVDGYEMDYEILEREKISKIFIKQTDWGQGDRANFAMGEYEGVTGSDVLAPPGEDEGPVEAAIALCRWEEDSNILNEGAAQKILWSQVLQGGPSLIRYWTRDSILILKGALKLFTITLLLPWGSVYFLVLAAKYLWEAMF